MRTAARRVRVPSRADLTSEEFARRLASHGHRPEEIRRLWEELVVDDARPADPRGTLGLGPVIAIYLGLLLVVAACVSLLVLYWDGLGGAGVLALSVAYGAGYLAAGEALRRRDLVDHGGVLEAVAVGWVGLAAYAVQELAGLWPDGAADRGEVHRGLTVIAAVAIVTAAALLVVRPDPLLLVPLAAATAVLAVDLAELAFGARVDDLSGRQAAVFVLPLGIAWIVAGLWLDVSARRPSATWAHWCGLALTGAAAMAIVPKTVPGFALVGVLGAAAMFLSALVRHWSFTVFGAFGVIFATAASMGELGRLAPVVIAAVGIALIAVGLRWSRWRDAIRLAVLARMPSRAREIVQRLGA